MTTKRNKGGFMRFNSAYNFFPHESFFQLDATIEREDIGVFSQSCSNHTKN